jgi:hypothetical protein
MPENYTEPVSRLGKCAVAVWSAFVPIYQSGLKMADVMDTVFFLGSCLTNYYHQETVINEFNA